MRGNLFINTMAIVLFALLASRTILYAQQIEYAIPLDDNIRTTSFDIIGLCEDNLLIYKQSYNNYKIALYDDHLKIKDQVPLKFLPPEVKQTDFINLGNKVIMIYQYMYKKDIYCEAVMLDKNAALLMKPSLVDRTIHPDKVVGEKAYGIIHSADKSKIMIFEVLRNDDSSLFYVHTFLYDSSLQLLHQGNISLPYLNDSDRLDKFSLSGKGDLYFVLAHKAYDSDDYYKNLILYYIPAFSNSVVDAIVPFNGHFPATSILLKLDESRQKLRINALGYNDALRNIDRLFTFHFDMDSLRLEKRAAVLLTDSLKKVMQDKNEGLRETFDDYYLSMMITDKEGNALVIAEERFADFNNIIHYDNLALFELDTAGSLLQTQKIKKEQGGDLSPTFASYLMVNTGHALHLLMNKSHRIFRFLNNYVYLLADYRYGADHQLKEMRVMRGLDNKKRWAPRYGRQVSRDEVVIPCVVGSTLLFGKITY
jgi:hypothetical protein